MKKSVCVCGVRVCACACVMCVCVFVCVQVFESVYLLQDKACTWSPGQLSATRNSSTGTTGISR